jgi:two-component system NtrC family sensor kinase
VTGAGRSLRAELLVNLGFVTSAAVMLVGVATIALGGGDFRETLWPLLALWVGSTAVFLLFGAYLVHRLVIRPLEVLAAEADILAAGRLSEARPVYETRELNRLSARYRALAEDLLDAQSHVVRVEKLAGIGRLAAGVAHEVRNPLGALGNYIEVLERRGTDPAVTVEMQRAVGRMERIVQGLVDYARPGGPANGNGRRPNTDLNAAASTVIDFLDAQGMLRGRTVAVALQPGLARIQGDRHALEQVVVNLVANACQASPSGRIAVGTVAKAYEARHQEANRRTDAEDEGLGQRRTWVSRPRRSDLPVGSPGAILYVADEGPGVPEADRERIFDPFFTTKEPGEGTGLGLAIVARTVHECGGVVWVDRAREGGAVFKVFLPLASESPCDC